MEPLLERLTLVDKHVQRAMSIAEADASASPVLRAVVKELQRKLAKASKTLTQDTSKWTQREAVVEVEQAADSANVAVQADAGASADTRKAVELAHMSMCMLKAEAQPG
ncbi:MAG: hypothetical protein ACHQ53_08485 [Polyangiales bacterium]